MTACRTAKWPLSWENAVLSTVFDKLRQGPTSLNWAAFSMPGYEEMELVILKTEWKETRPVEEHCGGALDAGPDCGGRPAFPLGSNVESGWYRDNTLILRCESGSGRTLPYRAVSSPTSADSSHSAQPPVASRRGGDPVQHRHQRPRGDVRRRLVAGAGGVLVSPDHGGVHPDRPLTLAGITATLQPGQHPRPGPVGRPAPVPVVHRLPVAVRGRQIPPRRPGPGAPQHPVDHQPVLVPLPATTRRPVGQQRHQQRPLLIDQVMAIMHTARLPNPTTQIRGTRPLKNPPPVSTNERLPTPVGNRSVHPGHYRRQAVSGNNVGKPRVTAIVDGCCSATRGSPPPTRTPTTRSTPSCGPASSGTTSTSIPPAAPRPAGPSSTWPSSCSAPATRSRSPAWTGSAVPCCTWSPSAPSCASAASNCTSST